MKLTVERYHKFKKTPQWYLFAALFFALNIYYAFFKEQYFQILLIAIALIALVVYLIVVPGSTELTVDEDHLKLGDMVAPYINAKGFFVIEDEELDFVHIVSNNKMRPTLKLNVPKDKTEKIAAILEKKIPYLENEQEPLIDRIQRILRF